MLKCTAAIFFRMVDWFRQKFGKRPTFDSHVEFNRIFFTPSKDCPFLRKLLMSLTFRERNLPTTMCKDKVQTKEK